MKVNERKLNSKMPLMLVAICCLFGFFVDCTQHVLVHQSPLQQQFVQPNVEYSPWSPLDVIDYSLDTKVNKVRSIQSTPLEIQSVPRGVGGLNRRNFENNPVDGKKQQVMTASTFRPTYKRRTFTTSTAASPTSTVKVEGNANRFKNYRRNSTDNRPSSTSRRPFTPKTTSEKVLVSSTSETPQTTKQSPLKKLPLTRGNFRPKEKGTENGTVEKGAKDDEENYPEHFKQLILKNKEVNTQQNDKNVLKKPIKPFKPTERVPTTRPLYPTRQNRFAGKITSTSTTEASSTVKKQHEQQLATTVTPKRPLRTRPRPTEKTRLNIGSTLQEPPTAKTTAIYATRAPVKQSVIEQKHVINTPTDEFKQIDPPIRETYFPRTSSIGSSALKYSSRFRNTDITGKTSNKVPSYQPTVPSITTPTLDLNDIDLERWREILPLAAELINSEAEIMTQSPSQTVSIYEALAEILSKPTESLSFLNNKSTDRTTLFSEAPISSTTTSSSTTTTTTTSTTTQKSTTSASEETSKENHILELLQKYKNETDALVSVKSPNIFSLAKKTHHDDDTRETQLEFDNELVIIDEHPEDTIKTAFSTDSTEKFDFPTTPLSVDSNSVSIFPNGHDFSSTFASTTVSPKVSSDSFENEISFDDKDFKSLTLEPVQQTSTEKVATRVTSSISSSMSTTSKHPQSSIASTTEKMTQQPETTTETFIPTTTENFIEKNYKVLQQLLGKTAQMSTTMSTTEMPSTILSTTQQIMSTTLPPSTSQKIVTTTLPPSTTQKIETSTLPPSTTLSILKTSPSTVPSTQSSTITTVRKTPSQTTRFTQVDTSSSSMTPIRQTSVISSFTTSIPLMSTNRLVTSTPSTSSSVIPINTTHRFSPLEIPSNPPTRSTNSPPKRKAPFSDAEDLDFLRQLANFINRGAINQIPSTTVRVTRPIITTTTSRSTTSTSTSTTTLPPPPSSSTTTQKIIPSTRLPTTYSDSDDLNFLNNLREYAKIINLTTERTNLAQKILELAMNRTSKSYDSNQAASNSEALRPAPFVTSTTQSPSAVVNKMTNTQNNINMMSAIIEQNRNPNAQTKLSPQEIEKTKQMLEKDLVQYNKDLQLLSLLIGRPLTDKDVAKLASANLGKPKVAPVQTTLSSTSTKQYTSSTSPIPAFKALTENETKFLQALQQIQTTRSSTTTSTTTEPPRTISSTRTRSQEAVLAELLAQQGIGPGNINQAPIQKILLQLQAERLNRDVTTTTTIRPFSPMPPLNNQAPRRPIIDGLSWLWRTWQETSPGRPRQQQTPQVQQPSFGQSFGGAGGGGGGQLSFDENDGQQQSVGGGSLSYPSSNQSPLGPNGFLGAAIGVTRAVSRFLGVALTGAGQVLQVALGGSSASTTSNASPLGIFGGSRL